MAKKAADRTPLTREAVLRRSLAIGDAEGLDAISLRRVASELGVTPMALYRYVASKEALLDALLEFVYGDIELPSPGAVGWWEGLATIAQSARRVLLAHPAAAAIAARRAVSGPNAFRILETILALLRAAGFDPESAVRVSTAYTRFLISLIALEASLLPELSAEERRQRALRSRFELESLPSDRYPNLIEAAPFIATPYDPDRTFDAAIELLKAGIEAQRPSD